VVRLLQWLLMLTAVAGGLWLAALAVMGYLQVPAPDTPRWHRVPVPTWMLLGGVVVGILLALVCRLAVRWSARGKARSAERRLRGAIDAVTDKLVIEPIEVEVEAYRSARHGVAAVLR
jgi:hypothetical protein